jgi:RimJ/RimL family protein N-acetyltransferase
VTDLATRYAQAIADRPDLPTPRLTLRRPGEADITAIVDVCGEPAVAFKLGRVPHPYGEKDVRFFLDAIVPEELVWGIFERDEQALIGMIGLHKIAADPTSLELGYYLSPDHWGRGLVTEAGVAVTAFGLALAGAAHLCAGYFEDNPASGRVLAKLGFVEVGRSERPCLASGLTHPSIEMRR